ncbi:hypothetical protein GCM10010275_04010 [Streptomyces litmocidini]|uniref:DUF2690 domain-containing protein n=1 Tax=Streptomyces litmocidini TaxID=67318 RepID=UPI00199C854D|nr:DUF2690 domain-containing protein [Streptomyces litmocidini]GGU72650.1 hypothetical protein GCM10010275_04010 [Streptomyces litmocidini]
MNTLTRKLATAGSALALAASGLLLTPSPASAATSCYGPSCTGLDPSTSVCQNDARTVATSSRGTELRYSPTCRSAWARQSGGMAMTIWVESSTGLERAAYYGGSGTVWTAMVDDKDIVDRVCGHVVEGGETCTSWY